MKGGFFHWTARLRRSRALRTNRSVHWSRIIMRNSVLETNALVALLENNSGQFTKWQSLDGFICFKRFQNIDWYSKSMSRRRTDLNTIQYGLMEHLKPSTNIKEPFVVTSNRSPFEYWNCSRAPAGEYKWIKMNWIKIWFKNLYYLLTIFP